MTCVDSGRDGGATRAEGLARGLRAPRSDEDAARPARAPGPLRAFPVDAALPHELEPSEIGAPRAS